MSIKQFFNKYFGKHHETKDKHPDPRMKTRYYKVTSERGFDTLQNMVEHSSAYVMKAASKEYGELSFYTKGRKIFIIATVIMQKPFQTSIDFTTSTEGVFPDFGQAAKVVNQLYERLDKELPSIK